MQIQEGHKFHFTFSELLVQYQYALSEGYTFLTCADYVHHKKSLPSNRVVVNRVDIDLSAKKAARLCSMFDDLGIKATFFVRLHAKEYNPLAFEEYRVLRSIVERGHELGYHSEIVDQAAIWGESAANCLRRDLKTIELYWGTGICGVASHGGMTGLNNLDFWKDHRPKDFGLLYEAYDKEPEFNLFQEALYVSDSNWTHWKCYDRGVLCPNDRRSFAEHISSHPPLVYLLIHPDTYFDNHFYE